MEIHGRFSLPKMIHDDLYVEKNMRIYILCILYIYTVHRNTCECECECVSVSVCVGVMYEFGGM